MGRFKKSFAENRIAEWTDQYLDYEGFVQQIQEIQQSVIHLAAAYGSIHQLKGIVHLSLCLTCPGKLDNTEVDIRAVKIEVGGTFLFSEKSAGPLLAHLNRRLGYRPKVLF
jgi:hypothetical protein